MDYYATLKTGLRLYASTRINPILLTRSPETALYSPGRKDLVQEIKSYKIVGRDGGGQNPEVGVLLGHEQTAGSCYGYRRHHCCLKRATSAFVPSARPSVVKEQDPVGKGFWELWSSGFYFL